MPAAAARCAASPTRAPARATPSTIRWAAPASSRRSVEFRQRIGKSFGAVAFVDAGSAYTDTLPDFSLFAPRIGAGVGVRYYTDFGPVRLDVGLPLNRREGDPPFGIYVSIGQAF